MPCLLRPASTKQTCAPQTLTGRARGGSDPGKMLGARCSRLTLAITLASTGCTTSRRADPPAGVGAPPTPAVTTPPREPHEVALATPPTSLTLEHEPVELVLLRALPIERRDNFQPSGLLWHEGKLLTVSDKHDDEIFELVVEELSVTVKSHRRFGLPPGVVELDLEGLCSDGAGGLLLASEAEVRVLRIGRDATVGWVTPSLERLGASVGLFTLPNAKLEGIARLDDGRIVVAAERSERGLIEVPADGDLARAQAWSMPLSAFWAPPGRSPDFSDLTTFDGELFALVRGAHLVVALQRATAGWVEGAAWSFATMENDDRFGYLDRTYGLAEGLALDGNHVYVVFDNNGNGRTAMPQDVRPQLLIFERPSR